MGGDIQLPLYICSFKPFRIETTTKKTIWESFGGNPLKLKFLAHLVQNKCWKLAVQDTTKSCGQALLRLATAAWTPRCISEIHSVPQLSIWSISDILSPLWMREEILVNQNRLSFSFLSLGCLGCFWVWDCSISTNALLRISVLLSKRTHGCHWVASMRQQMTGVTSTKGHTRAWACIRALHLPNNRFSNTLQLCPSFILNYFTPGSPPLSAKVAPKDLHTRCHIAL